MPKLIVGVSAYNEAQYLDETIPAILNQSMADFALLIVDNGSTDDTFAICSHYAAHDERVTLLREPTNVWGAVIANTYWPIALARWPETRWLLAQGADDIMLPGYLQAITDAIDANPDCNCVFSPWSYIGGVLPNKHFPTFDPETCHAVHQMPAWRAITRELWDTVGPENEDIRIGSDWEWPVRARHVLRTVQLERPYIALRVRGGGRLSQSEEVNWPQLHNHLCGVAGKPVPAWAR